MPKGVEGQPVAPPRRTLAGTAHVEGIGLFTGAPARVTLRPMGDAGAEGGGAEGGGATGIVFRRTDLGGTPLVRAAIENVVSEQRRTVLQASGSGGRVETVEHILSALAGLGITDALIDIDGPEVPIGDGSALAFVEAVRTAGAATLPDMRPATLRITRPLAVGENGVRVEVFPAESTNPHGADGCEYTYRLDYGPASPIGAHEATFFMPIDEKLDARAYIDCIAPARTFSTLAEAHAMQQMGMFKQFQPRDLLVIGPDGPVDNTLRFPDEPARHKVLDMIGDLSLCGRPIIGRIVATRSGHALNHEVARALASLP